MNNDIKVAFSMIVFNGQFFIKQVLESIYEEAHQILISEGTVGYWKDKGFTTSTDGTNEIIHSFYDPDKKIKIAHGTYDEKTEQSNALAQYFQDSDYIWQVDSDEVYKQDDIKTICNLLKTYNFTSAGLKSCTFYGGFDRMLGGFERSAEFHRIGKSGPNASWGNHRPPTVYVPGFYEPRKHLDMNWLYENFGVQFYHYSYVSPVATKTKIDYYENKIINKGECIPNYFRDVYLAWVLGDDNKKKEIEDTYNGVHEFVPKVRGECRTEKFEGEHPDSITKDMTLLSNKFKTELEYLLGNQI